MIIETDLELDGIESQVRIEFEYEPAEGDGWNEPHFPEQVTILSATTAFGLDIDWELVEDDLIDICLEHVRDERAQYAMDLADHIYHSQIEGRATC